MTDQIARELQRFKNPIDPLSKLLRVFVFLLLVRVAAAFVNAYQSIELAHPIDVSFVDQFLLSLFTAAMALVNPTRADRHGDRS